MPPMLLLLCALFAVVVLFTSRVPTILETYMTGGATLFAYIVCALGFVAARMSQGTPWGWGDYLLGILWAFYTVYGLGKDRGWDVPVERRVPGGWLVLYLGVLLGVLALNYTCNPERASDLVHFALAGMIVGVSMYTLVTRRHKVE